MTQQDNKAINIGFYCGHNTEVQLGPMVFSLDEGGWSKEGAFNDLARYLFAYFMGNIWDYKDLCEHDHTTVDTPYCPHCGEPPRVGEHLPYRTHFEGWLLELAYMKIYQWAPFEDIRGWEPCYLEEGGPIHVMCTEGGEGLIADLAAKHFPDEAHW